MSDQEVNIKDLKGEKIDLDNLEQDEKLIQTVLADVETRKTKSENPRDYWIYTTPEDDRGMQMAFVTFSSTFNEILKDALTNERSLKIVYKIPAKYGSFTVSTVELPDGTYATKEAKTAWKKGNMKNNRQAALQAAATMYSGADAGKVKADNVIELADHFLKWIEKE